MSSRSFPRDAALGNSKFETYKLSALAASSSSSFALPGAAVTQARVQHGKTTLSAREVGSRIRHDHLHLCWGGWIGWVDEEWEVWAAKLSPDDLAPQFSSLGSLPAPMEKDDAPPSEYPSVHALSPTTYVSSDGYGRLYPLLVQPGAALSATFGPAYELSDAATGELRPFKVEWVGGDRRALVSAVRRTKTDDGWGKEEGWDLLLVTFGEDWSVGLGGGSEDGGEEPSMSSGDDSATPARTLEVLWSVVGQDAPVVAHCNGTRLLLASSEAYSLPSSVDGGGAPAADGVVGAPSGSSTSAEPVYLPQHPFSWTQTSTTVTVSVALPPSTPRAHVHPTIGSRSLSILVGEGSWAQVALEGFAQREWWDSVKLDESFWEWDAEQGLVTLELEKANPQTRWPHLFLPSGTTPAHADVPEELAPDARKAIAADLDRFSSALDLPDSAPGGIASIMREEMDIDDEFEDEGLAADGEARVGRVVRWTFVDATEDGGGKGILDVGAAVKTTVLQGTEALVAGPLEWTQNGFAKPDTALPAVLLKHSLDALLFSPPATPPTTTFGHIKTFPALAFVLSSKRQTKYILHATSTVLAFSTPTTASAQGDLFVYRDAEGKDTAASGVVKLGGGEDGELLGVKGVRVGGEGDGVLVALCERRLVVVRGLL